MNFTAMQILFDKISTKAKFPAKKKKMKA